MPLYEYELCEGKCKICQGKFTLNRSLHAPPLEKCPLCKKPVRKLVSSINTPRLTAPISLSQAKNAGFKIYKKIGTGEYERS